MNGKTINTVTVGLGARSYDVHTGPDLIDEAATLIAPLLKRPRVTIVTDTNVHAAQGTRLMTALLNGGLACDVIALPPGEATKSFHQLETLLDELLRRGVERDDVIVAFGGGVIGDLVGLAAGLLRRGCRFIQIPTSLLAQVDSSVGGKTAINARAGKNLIGLFNQPVLVLADITSLTSLPARDLKAGYAEVVKYGALGDAAFFDWLDAHLDAFLAGDTDVRAQAVAQCVTAKAAIVKKDERETGERALLNLGHTFGHALEAIYGFDNRLLHGEAVAAGMGLAFDYSCAEGICPPADSARFKDHLKKAGLPSGLHDLPEGPTVTRSAMLNGMAQDKKVTQGAMTLILTRGIGHAFIARDIDQRKLSDFLDHALSGNTQTFLPV